MPCDDGVCNDTASGVRLGVNGANVCRPCGNTGRPQCQSALLVLHVLHVVHLLLSAYQFARVCFWKLLSCLITACIPHALQAAPLVRSSPFARRIAVQIPD